MDLAELSILVVEHDGFQRWLVKRQLLELDAADVVCAGDGHAALEQLALRHFDVVISDLDLPGMDGMELIRRLSELAAAPDVIVISSQANAIVHSVRDMAEAYGVRVRGTIAKPATVATLAALLTGFLPAVVGRAPACTRNSHSEADLTAAIRLGHVAAWFQPKVSVAGREIIGAEALARWILPSGEVREPGSFLPQVERLGLMPQLTDAIAAQAFAGCARWRRQGVRAKVCLNMPLTVLAAQGVAEALTGTVDSHGLVPQDVVVEVTESAAAPSLGPALESLARLRMRGFGLSLDDFGTGYASMERLTCIPFSELKIDRSFVRDAASRRARRLGFEASVAVAARLGLQTVAEGVESAEDWRVVQELGCDMAQGWLLGRAMPLHEFIAAARRS
jgi:EAL domain-containing protein (putative c-di-GMP-specific phosphodiesterase class I)/FixJ family two-component response regulator